MKLSTEPFSHGEPGSMNNVLTPLRRRGGRRHGGRRRAARGRTSRGARGRGEGRFLRREMRRCSDAKCDSARGGRGWHARAENDGTRGHHSGYRGINADCAGSGNPRSGQHRFRSCDGSPGVNDDRYGRRRRIRRSSRRSRCRSPARSRRPGVATTDGGAAARRRGDRGRGRPAPGPTWQARPGARCPSLALRHVTQVRLARDW